MISKNRVKPFQDITSSSADVVSMFLSIYRIVVSS